MIIIHTPLLLILIIIYVSYLTRIYVYIYFHPLIKNFELQSLNIFSSNRSGLL